MLDSVAVNNEAESSGLLYSPRNRCPWSFERISALNYNYEEKKSDDKVPVASSPGLK